MIRVGGEEKYTCSTAVAALLLFCILSTNEVGSLLKIPDLIIQVVSAFLFFVVTFRFIRPGWPAISYKNLAFVGLFSLICVQGVIQQNDEKSLNKLIETVGIYSPLLYGLLLKKKYRYEVLIAFVKITLLYQIVVFGFYVYAFADGSIIVASRSGAISESYHRIGRMVTIGMIGYLGLVSTLR